MTTTQRFNPFARVAGTYGAPMGRHGRGAYEGGRLYAQHQGGCEGYDKGGAYWGLPHDVYAVYTRGGAFLAYVRAPNREAAIRETLDNAKGV